MSLLITGFEPFNGETLNPSQLLAQKLARSRGLDVEILPVSYKRSFEVLRDRLESGRYKGLLSIGQAAGRSKVCLERVALNLEDADLADADLVTKVESAIDLNGPTAHLNPLPLRQYVREFKMRGRPVEISTSAGAYVCNSLYYQTFRWMEKNPRALAFQLFVHVPFLPEQAERKPGLVPSLEMSEMEASLSELIDLLIERLPS
ncbi:MAG: hypothetical protein KF681_07330 [Bdellovibrionaceae bacterium]|nr:hypothetical protein [Pseudobdellovibrionaceae bacterium]